MKSVKSMHEYGGMIWFMESVHENEQFLHSDNGSVMEILMLPYKYGCMIHFVESAHEGE